MSDEVLDDEKKLKKVEITEFSSPEEIKEESKERLVKTHQNIESGKSRLTTLQNRQNRRRLQKLGRRLSVAQKQEKLIKEKAEKKKVKKKKKDAVAKEARKKTRRRSSKSGRKK